MNPSDRPDYSTLEVDDGRLPQAQWQEASALPEVSHGPGNIDAETSLADKSSAEKTVAAPGTSAASGTICGLRRRTFWILTVVILAIITAAAVGGGVGGSEAAKSKSAATTSFSSTTSSTSAPTSAAPTPSTTGLLANSALASLNYTDHNNVDHVRVYYQVASKAIYQSAWNSSAKSWTVIPVTTADAVNNVNTDMDVLPQTPISANIYWHSSSEIDFHVYYLNSASALQELFINGPASGDGPWSVSGLNGQYSLGPSSRMISYGRACANCFDRSMIVYEGAKNDLKLVQLINNNFQQSSIGADLPTPVVGSAFAIIPGAGNKRTVAMYFNGVNLDEIYYDGSDWTWTQKLTSILSSTASIAAFAYGINGTASGSNGIEVLSTNSSSSSSTTLTPAGLSLMSWNTAGGWQGPKTPSMFAKVMSSSGLAANLAGKVYAVVVGNTTTGGGSGGSSESEYSLMEWQFTGTPGSYNLVGKVTTL